MTFTATPGFYKLSFQNKRSNRYKTEAPIHSVLPLANGDVVTVDVTNTNSCLSTFDSVTMAVNALPDGILLFHENSGITPNDGIICAGAAVYFTAPAGFTNYNFLLNGTSVQSNRQILIPILL